jgi:hypothetical protein
MSKVNKQRMFGKMDGDFVVFIIGMRINNLWKVNRWLPVAIAMPKMLKELFRKPESGFLGAQQWLGRTTVMIQYWRSFDHLEAYAKDKNGEHYPAWKKFNMKIRKSGAAGVWHETYKISEGNYENIYVNMPRFGLGKVGKLMTASEMYEDARGRMEINYKL